MSGGQKQPNFDDLSKLLKPTKAELEMMNIQKDTLKKQLEQSDTLFGYYQGDRQKLQDQLDYMLTPGSNQLGDYEKQLARDLAARYMELGNNNINEGVTGQTLNKMTNDSIANLASRGILDSYVTSNVLGDVEKERMRLYKDVGTEAAMQEIGTILDLMGQNRTSQFNIAQLRNASMAGLPGQSAQLQGLATGNAASVAQALGNQRMLEYNAKMGQMNAQMAARKSGGLMGGATGALGGAMMGGMVGGPWGAAAGAAIGGGLGYFGR